MTTIEIQTNKMLSVDGGVYVYNSHIIILIKSIIFYVYEKHVAVKRMPITNKLSKCQVPPNPESQSPFPFAHSSHKLQICQTIDILPIVLPIILIKVYTLVWLLLHAPTPISLSQTEPILQFKSYGRDTVNALLRGCVW